MQIYEIYNELIKDLMVVPGVYTENLDVQENPEKGSFVKVKETHIVALTGSLSLSGQYLYICLQQFF